MRRYALKTALLMAFWALMLAAGQMFDQGRNLVGMLEAMSYSCGGWVETA